MLYADKLEEGQFIKVIVAEGEYQGSYRTKIVAVQENSTLSIGVPMIEGEFVPLRVRTKIEVVFSDSISAYSFQSTILERLAEPIPTLIIKYPGIIQKIQRRKYVRIPLTRPLKYRVFREQGNEDEKIGAMKDLSGGGLRFQTKEELPLQTKLTVRANMDTKELEIPGLVIRTTKDEETDLYNISIQFLDISEKTRDEIISYVFKIQREMLRKGLI
ncbi:MAG TPA: pilus assembly protein PilZ [Peptococcaceae bacterium]|nr:pilus assembly protein PilZ [Peptococcaceae bacterium]